MIQNVVGAALKAAAPADAVATAVERLDDRWLRVASQLIDLAVSDFVVVGMGKAAVTMATGLLASIAVPRERIRGAIVTKYGHVAAGDRAALAPLEVFEAAHPVPDAAGVAAATAIKSLVASAHPRTSLVFVLISGGGSALLPLPPAGVTLGDLQQLSGALLAAGMPIQEMNVIRKHCSEVAGGRLADACSSDHAAATAASSSAGGTLDGARVVTLVLSDVIGDPLHTIASGPTVADAPGSTFTECLRLLHAYGLAPPPPSDSDSVACAASGAAAPAGAAPAAAAGAAAPAAVPASILHHLREGAAGRRRETPKAVDTRAVTCLVGTNGTAVAAAAAACAAGGVTPVVLSTCIEGEAKETAKALASMAMSVLSEEAAAAAAAAAATTTTTTTTTSSSSSAGGSALLRSLGRPPLALIAGGETTVTLPPVHGRGGRNQELALAGALALEDLVTRILPPTSPVEVAALAERVTFVSFGTDGTDGPTDAAGAAVSIATLKAARGCGLDPAAYLRNHDAYGFYTALDAALAARRGREGGGSGGAAAATAASSPSAAAGSSSSSSIDVRASGLIVTGPTGTNVMDIMMVLIT